MVDGGEFDIAQDRPLSLGTDNPAVDADPLAGQGDQRLTGKMSDHLVAIDPADHHKTDEGVGQDVGLDAPPTLVPSTLGMDVTGKA